MKTKIITSGDKYIDIDGLASSTAYQKFLELRDVPATVVFTPPFNQSISETVLDWGLSCKKKIPSGLKKEDLEFVIMDVSDPEHFDACVIEDQVVEIFDHHFGYEKIWEKRIGSKARIEPVGATATMIFELYEEHSFLGQVETAVANVLYTAIISNSLNLNAQITKQRDRDAVKKLKNFIDLPKDWIASYYSEIEEYRLKNPVEAIENDTKFQKIKGDTYAIGQAELWDSKPFIFNYKTQIMNSMKKTDSKYAFMTTPSISEGKNYIITQDDELKKKLKKAIKAKFDGDLGQTDKIWLRKEIIRELQK